MGSRIMNRVEGRDYHEIEVARREMRKRVKWIFKHDCN